MRNLLFIALALVLTGCASSAPQRTVMAPKAAESEVASAAVEEEAAPPKDKVAIARDKVALDREIAENAGLLGALRDAPEDNIFGSSALSSDLSGGVGGLIGAKGTQIGAGGLGSRGSGVGGGGYGGGGIGGLGSRGSGMGGGGKRIKGKVDLGATTASGMSDADVRKVLVRRAPALLRCYENALTRNPKLDGAAIEFSVKVSKVGRVESVGVRSAGPFDEATAECFSQRLKAIRFLPPASPGVFTQILRFSKK